MAKRRAKRKTRTTAKSRRRRRRLLVWGSLILAALLLAVGLHWWGSESGRSWAAAKGLPSAKAEIRGELHEALLATVRSQDLADSMQLIDGPRPGVRTLKVTTRRPLLDLNIAFSAATLAAGGEILRGERHSASRGETVELQLGVGGEMSHRILLQRGPAAPTPPPPPKARLAIVVDDFGHNLGSTARAILDLDYPLSVAILPELPYSRRVLTEARRADKPALLHLPMEPEGDSSPGEPALLTGMEPHLVEALVERCLDELPGVVGVNNHMGSRATASRPEMEAVMGVLAKRGLVFLDSWTTARSVAWQAARDLGVPSLRNDLFLDVDTEDAAEVEGRLRRIIAIAQKRGWGIAICHVNAHSLAALRRVLPTLDPAEIQLVGIDELIHGEAPGAKATTP